MEKAKLSSSRAKPRPAKSRLAKRGELIGGYRLKSLLGVGGFGEVWRAQEELEGQKLGALRAVKLVSLGGTSGGKHASEHMGGFIDEVRALRSVECPAIPRTYHADYVREREIAYIAMELLEGQTLAQRMKERGPIPWRRALAIAAAIASALDLAHALQPPLVHCDLKPHNVFLTNDGRVCVIDWGIARLQGGIAAATTARLATIDGGTNVEGSGSFTVGTLTEGALTAGTLTEGTLTAGTLTAPPNSLPPVSAIPASRRAAGTPGYIAPEVYGGALPSPAADRYALGVVLYQMIAGRLAVSAGSHGPEHQWQWQRP